MERIFIDSDIILDLLLEREPYFQYSERLFILIEEKKIEACVSSLIFSNLFYITRKIKGSNEARNLLRKLKYLLTVLPIDDKIIELALNSRFDDFEDAIQYYACMLNDIDIIITRNLKNFKTSELPVMTAKDYLSMEKK